MKSIRSSLPRSILQNYPNTKPKSPYPEEAFDLRSGVSRDPSPSREFTITGPDCDANSVSSPKTYIITKHLSHFIKECNPILKSSSRHPISSQIRKSRSFSNAISVSSTNSQLNNEPISSPVSNLSKSNKTRVEPSFPCPTRRRSTHTRSFSSEDSNKGSDPAASDAISDSSTVSSPYDRSAPIDAGSSLRKPISLWPGMYHSPVTNALWEARSKMYEKVGGKTADAISQGELVGKSPSSSRTSIVYNLSSDYILREQYRNPWNEIRMGKLLEDLDALAGTISFKHCCSDDGKTRPILLVTASVDRMVLNKAIHADADLKIVGAVTWVGRSSMEIQMEVIQSVEDTSDPTDSLALVANFTFVARDPKTGKSAVINQILPETEREKLLWKEAEERNKIRKQKRAELTIGTTKKDADRLDALLAEGRIFCDMPALADRDSILIRNTSHENSLICQPQQRNIHGRIFGGFLMRKAFELAYANAYAFIGATPRFLEVDHVDFFKPVDVGNFLRFKSRVLYTELENPSEPMINVEVVAHVTRPELRSSEVSNKFYFTFSVRSEAMKDGLRIRNVVPATEEEARQVLERMDAERSLVAKS